MGRDGSKKLKVAQIKPLRSGTFGCSHTSRLDARKTGAFAPISHGILPQCGAFVVFELPMEQKSDRQERARGPAPAGSHYSPSSQLPSLPPMTAPRIGATQNSQTWDSGSPPA